MSDTTVVFQERYLLSRLDPQRRAWGILLLCFAFFCIICVVTGVGLSYFLFQSTMSLETILQVGRGTGVVSGQAVVGGELGLSNGNTLRTDPQSQATIFFRDDLQANRLVSAITLRGDTTLTTWRMTRPRFEWNRGQYGIELHDLLGEVDVFIPNNLNQDVRVSVFTQQGDQIDMSSGGQYTLSVSNNQIRIVNHTGTTYLIPANTREGRSIPPQNTGTLLYSDNSTDSATVTVSASFVNLISNSTFQDIYTPPDNPGGDTQSVATNWACTNTQDDLPRGTYRTDRVDGRFIMHLVRAENAISHGATGCSQYLGQTGQDISQYQYLALRATFNINYQSLNGCGTDASECPLMLRLDYKDEQGKDQFWVHGFYYFLDPQLGYPLQCNACSQEHESLYEKSWYVYDSGNLFNLIPADKRPSSILSVTFYASGHQYDLSVGEVALLAGDNALS